MTKKDASTHEGPMEEKETLGITALDAECRKPINVLREAKDTLNKPQPTLDSYTDRRGKACAIGQR